MASRSLGTLTLDLVAKIGGFEQSMDKAARITDQRARQMEKIGKRIGVAIGAAITVGIGALSTASYAIKSMINNMDDLSKAAQRASLPTEDFTRLAYAGSLADVSVEDLTKALGKLAKAQGDAQAGLKTQTDAFKQLGIAFSDSAGHLRSTKDVFLDFADVFQKYQGTPEVVAAGMQIFGRSFQTLIPLLKDGSAGLREASDEADRLGITLSTEAGKQAEAFNDNLTRLKTAFDGIVQSVAADLLPELIKLSEQMLKFVTDGDGAAKVANDIASGIHDIADAGRDFGNLFRQFLRLGDILMGLQTQSEAFGQSIHAALTLNTKEFEAAAEKYKRGAAQIQAGFDGPKQTFANPLAGTPALINIPSLDKGGFNFAQTPGQFNFAQALTPRLTPIFPPEKKAKTKKAGKAKKSDEEIEAERLLAAYQNLIESQKERIALFGKEGEAVQVRYDTEFGALKNLTPEQKKLLIANAERLDQMREEADLQDKLDDINKRREEAAGNLLKDIQDEIILMGLSNEQQEIYNNLKYAGVKANTALGESIIKATEQLQRSRETRVVIDQLKDASKSLLVDLADGAVSARDAWDNFFDTIKQRALQFVADKIINQFFDMLSGNSKGGGTGVAPSGGTASGGGFWASVAGWFGGLFGGGHAAGGPVMPGKFYEVGEGDKPELLMSRGKQYLIPGNQGSVVPIGAGGGGVNMTANFILSRRIDHNTQQQIAVRSGNAVREATRRNRGR